MASHAASILTRLLLVAAQVSLFFLWLTSHRLRMEWEYGTAMVIASVILVLSERRQRA